MNTYRVDNFLLEDEWNEKDVFGGISYVVRGGESQKEHLEFVEKFKKELLEQNDEDYTSWVFTQSIYKNIEGYDPHVSVLHFRVRDAG